MTIEPINHLEPLTKISSPFLMPNQLVREQAFQGVAHLLRRTLAQAWSFSPYNLQLSLASKAMFFDPAANRPRSPSFFGTRQLIGILILLPLFSHWS